MERVRVASIFPMPRSLYKPRFLPQNNWRMPAVKRGHPPVVIEFTDQQERVYIGDDGRGGEKHMSVTIYAHEIAADFVQSNTVMAFANGSAHPGIWVVDTLGEDTGLQIAGATNGTATHLRFNEPHGLSAPSPVNITGAIGYWAMLNAGWTGTPVNEDTLSIPLDSTAFGEFGNAGNQVIAHIHRHLTLEQEASIIRERQNAFFQKWVNDARKWAARKELNRIITMHHIAAEALGVKEDWQNTEEVSPQCQYCRQHIPADAVVCPQCTRVVNVVAYARLQAEEKAAVAAATAQQKPPMPPVKSSDLKQELHAMGLR